MNVKISKSTEKVEKYKFNDHFLKKFDKMANLYDAQLKRLRSIEKEINGMSHGVCNTGYNLRYITPSDISTFVSNLDTALSQGLIHPILSDCNMFAVASVTKFMKEHNCVNFVNTMVSGNKAPVPKTDTLKDLEMYVGNEVFKREVYTKYEMSQRINTLKEDIKKMDDMHFTAATRALVSKLPTIITKHSETACSCEDIKSKEVFGMLVAHFIGFAIKLNLSTVVQMLNYACPKVKFNEVEDKEMKVTASTVQEYAAMLNDGESEIITEAVNIKEKNPVLFVFTEGVGFPVSNIIKQVTKSKFSHMGISFDPKLKEIYTYGPRGEHRENYVSGETGIGFIVESVQDLKRKNIKMSVMCGFVDNDKIKKMKDEIQDFAKHKTKFDLRIFERFLIKKDKKPGKDKYAQVCSTFCDYIMESGNIKVTEKNLSSPADIKNKLDDRAEVLNNVFEVFYGDSNNYIEESADIKIKDFAVQSQTRAFDEYYTECYHITKMDSEVRSKIPFGCNFRDIVLGDDHEFYKNTECALRYITTNPRSPFHHLIVQFADPDGNDCDVSHNVDTIMKIFFGDRLYYCDFGEDPYHRPDVQFPSDPNWMDKIAYGNAYYDMNYRRDNPGNQHSDPITAKFDMIYKMFGHVHHETDSKKLVCNIQKIVNIMQAIICARRNATEWQMPRQMSTDVLAVFGDILTKTLMKLYHLNTVVIDFDDTMDETMIPGYMYEESYIENEYGSLVQESYIVMEAETTTDDAGMPKIKAEEVADSKVSNANEKDMKGAAKAKHALSGIIKKVIDWVSNTLGKAFNNWEKAYDKLIKYVEASETATLVNEIKSALGNKSFNIKIENFVPYNVQMKMFNGINPETAVAEAIKEFATQEAGRTIEDMSQEAADAFEKKLYPDAIYDEIKKIHSEAITDTAEANKTADTNTVTNRGNAIRNYFLFAATKAPDPKTVDLTAEQFEEIYNMLKETKSCEPIFNKLTDSFTKALKEISAAIDKVKADATNQNMSEEQKQQMFKENQVLKNLNKIFNITNHASQAVNRSTVDGLVGIPTKETGYDAYKKSFWGKNYTIFKAVIDEYKTRDKDYKGTENAEEKTETQTAAAQQTQQPVTPAANNADAAAASTPAAQNQ